MKVKQRFWLLPLLFAFFSIFNLEGQVTIGLDKEPASGALLDLRNQSNSSVTATKGLGLPRVYLEAIDDLRPALTGSDATDPIQMNTHLGLMVYNVNDNPPFDTDGAGVYIWEGAKWTKLPTLETPPENPISSGNGMTPPVTNSDLYLPNSYIIGTNKDGVNSLKVPVKKAFAFWKEYNAPVGALAGFNNPTGTSVNDNLDLEHILGLSGYTAKAVLLWQSSAGLIKNATAGTNELPLSSGTINGEITIETASGRDSDGGNALIAFVINDGTNDVIYWSWHIWVTDFDPDATAYTYSNSTAKATKTYMDRNLGALSNTMNNTKSGGLLYQWGRKDPFTGIYGESKGTNANTGSSEAALYDAVGTVAYNLIRVDNTQTANNLANSIQNPLVFYLGAGTANDWYTNTAYTYFGAQTRHLVQNDYLWSENGKKTPFDPCPEGWRVPPIISGRTPWYYGGYPTSPNDTNGLSPDGCFGATTHDIATNRGFMFANSGYNIGFYSVTGVRNASNGMLTAPTTNGSYWIASASSNRVSASVFRDTAYMWSLENTSVYMGKNGQRANGYAIRCIKE